MTSADDATSGAREPTAGFSRRACQPRGSAVVGGYMNVIELERCPRCAKVGRRADHDCPVRPPPPADPELQTLLTATWARLGPERRALARRMFGRRGAMPSAPPTEPDPPTATIHELGRCVVCQHVAGLTFALCPDCRLIWPPRVAFLLWLMRQDAAVARYVYGEIRCAKTRRLYHALFGPPLGAIP